MIQDSFLLLWTERKKTFFGRLLRKQTSHSDDNIFHSLKEALAYTKSTVPAELWKIDKSGFIYAQMRGSTYAIVEASNLI